MFELDKSLELTSEKVLTWADRTYRTEGGLRSVRGLPPDAEAASEAVCDMQTPVAIRNRVIDKSRQRRLGTECAHKRSGPARNRRQGCVIENGAACVRRAIVAIVMS